MSKFKTIRRVVRVVCPVCGGLGILAVQNGGKVCSECGGLGETEKVVNEIIHDEEDEYARPN